MSAGQGATTGAHTGASSTRRQFNLAAAACCCCRAGGAVRLAGQRRADAYQGSANLETEGRC